MGARSRLLAHALELERESPYSRYSIPLSSCLSFSRAEHHAINATMVPLRLSARHQRSLWRPWQQHETADESNRHDVIERGDCDGIVVVGRLVRGRERRSVSALLSTVTAVSNAAFPSKVQLLKMRYMFLKGHLIFKFSQNGAPHLLQIAIFDRRMYLRYSN